MKIILHFESLKKAISLLTIFISFCFLLNPASASNFASKEEQSKVSSLSVAVSGESVIIASPCVPAVASVGKKNYQSRRGFNDKGIVHSIFNSSLEKSILSSYSNQFFFCGKYSLRLHLAFCVLLI